MSEHDEPKTALTRLVNQHAVDLVDTSPNEDYIIAKAVCRTCGDVGSATPAAHLADVLLAEGYTTSPAPETTEREARLAAENERLRNTLADVRAAHTQARAALLQHQTSTTSTGDRP